MIKLVFVLIFGILRILLVLAALALLVALIALPFVLIGKGLRALSHRPPPAELYIAKETTMPAFLSVISYTLLVALMLGVALGWIGGL